MKRTLACIAGLLVHSSFALAQEQPSMGGAAPPPAQPQPVCGTPTTPPCANVNPGMQPMTGPQTIPGPQGPQPMQGPQPIQQAAPPPALNQPCGGPGLPACQYAPIGQPVPGQILPPAPPPVVKKEEDKQRSDGEMTYLIGTSIGVGIGTGVWIDELGKIDNPGAAVIAPALLATALPIGAFIWDHESKFNRGVPSSMATGFLLGAGEGVGISAAAELNTSAGNGIGITTATSISWLTMVGGGVGGYFFGEWLQPDPRSMTFIASGSAWGAASFFLIGAGAAKTDKWSQTGSVLGVIGYNLGLVTTGALSTFYTPSNETQKYMWMGYGIGTVGSSLVYIFYLFSNSDAKGGLIANGVGGLAGLGIAAALTADLKDDEDEKKTAWKAPFDLGLAPAPRLNQQATESPRGMLLTAHGTW